MAQMIKNLPATQEIWVQSLDWEDPLEKGKATHSSILAWRIPWTVCNMGSQRVRRDWATFTFTWFSLLLLFSSCAEQGLLSSCCAQASHWGSFSSCRAQALGHVGFSSCGSWVLEHRLNSCGTQAPWHVGSFRIRSQTHVSCIGRQILYYHRSPVVFFQM